MDIKFNGGVESIPTIDQRRENLEPLTPHENEVVFQPEKKDYSVELRNRRIEVFDMKKLKNLYAAVEIIQQKISNNITEEMRVLGKLKGGGELEGGEDYSTVVSELILGDLSLDQIERLVEGVEKSDTGRVVESLIEEEALYVLEKISSIDFIKALDRSTANMKMMLLSSNLSDEGKSEIPKVVYSGFVGRMLIKTEKDGYLVTNCMAGAEYDHADKTAYLYLGPKNERSEK